MIGWLFGSDGEVDRLRAEIGILRYDAREADALIEKLDGDRDELIEEVAALRTERDRAIAEHNFRERERDALAERLAISQREELAHRREVERLRSVLREIGEAARDSVETTNGPIARQPDPRAIAGQSSGQSGRWGDTGTNLVWREGDAPDPDGPWIRVADAVPDYHDEHVVALAGGMPWLAQCSPVGGWRDCYGHCLDGVTHWARWPVRSGVAGGRESGSGRVHRGGDSPDVDPEDLGDGGVAVDPGLLRATHPVVGGDSGHTDSVGELFHGQAGGGEEQAHGGHGGDCAR